MRLDGEKVSLKLAGHKIVEVPLNSLSDDDVAKIKTWWDENKDKVAAKNLRLTILKNTKKIDREVNKTGGAGKSGNNKA